MSLCFFNYPCFNLIKVSLNMKYWNGIVRAWCADITLSFIFYPTKRDFIAAHKYQMSSDFFCYQTCLWHASMFYQGVIQQLRGLNFTQFWPPPPSNGQFMTFYMIPTQGPCLHRLAMGALAPAIFWHFITGRRGSWKNSIKVHFFLEGHKNYWNLHGRFDIM